MRILLFHTFQTEAELLCSLLGTPGDGLTAVSAETLGAAPGFGPGIDAVLVDKESLALWYDFDRLVPSGACRMVADRDESFWADWLPLPALFDQRVHVDLSLPPWEVTRRIVDAVARCSKVDDPRASGPGSDRSAVGLPDPTSIDEVNARILTLIAFGLSDKEISTSMCLSAQTIRNRVSRMLQDGAFRNRTALATHFLRAARTDVLRRAPVTPIADTVD